MSAGETIAPGERIVLRKLTLADAEFIFALVNDPAFIRYIGDRNVRTLEDAELYLLKGPLASYAKFGFGLWLVALRDGTPIGICGLLKRAELEEVDLGFAFLENFRGKGYAAESSRVVMAYAERELNLPSLAAIVQGGNADSIRLLEKLGFRQARTVKLGANEAELLVFLQGGGTRSPQPVIPNPA